MKNYKGSNGYIVLCDRGVFISQGIRGSLFGGRILFNLKVKMSFEGQILETME